MGKSPAATLVAGAVIRGATAAPTAPSRAVALLVFDDWERLEAAAGRLVPRSVAWVFADVVRHAFESSPLRVARGEVEAWTSQLTKRVARTARNAAMRRLRAAGLIAGRPNDPDPANDFYRDPARYRVTIPACCTQLLARLKWAAKRSLDAITPGRNEGRSSVRPRGFVIALESQSPTTTRVDRDDGAGGGVDNAPRRPLPDDYRAAKVAAGWA